MGAPNLDQYKRIGPKHGGEQRKRTSISLPQSLADKVEAANLNLSLFVQDKLKELFGDVGEAEGDDNSDL